jgi:arylsulfatase A-like enzyme
LTAREAQIAASLCLTVVMGGAACSGRAPAPARAEGVILVSIDSLRPDHLGCYGYATATSPNLDTLCRDSVVFTQAIAHAPSTLSSHASLLTSLIPQHHGASVTRMVALARDHLTLASALASAGFHTASFNGGGQIDALFGLDHGFQVYQSPRPAHDEEAWARDVGADRFGTVVAAAGGWLDENRGRFFLFLHTYEVHHPYRPDPAFSTLLPESYDGPLPGDISIDLLERINAGRLEATPKDLAHVVHAYDVEIRSVDAALGVLVADLKRRGLYDRTLLIVTSDHGEEFGEHGKMGWHSHTLHDELLRVPLVVKFPGSWRAGTSLDAQVRGIDVAPTVMSVARIAIPPAFEGVDLVRYAGRGERPPPYAIAEIDGGGGGVRSQEWKWDRRSLYRLASDRGETADVARTYPGMAEKLRRIKQALVSEDENASPSTVVPTADLRERLRGLGYVE